MQQNLQDRSRMVIQRVKKEKALVKSLKEEVRGFINSSESPLSDSDVLHHIEGIVLGHEMGEWFSFKAKEQIINTVYYSTRKDLDLLHPYVEDEDVSEIMVNGTDSIFVERYGKMTKLPHQFENKEELEEIIRRIAAKVHREINELNPILDARLEDGSRVNAVYKNVALNGPILTIRKFPQNRIQMEDLLSLGTITQEAADYMKKLILAGYNIFISGGTSSGKTTFLNVLSNFIPKDERIIVIEDSAELQISEIENIVRLECKNGNVQGKGEVTIKQLIKSSLRMRPDRIIVGEVRGSEVVDMVQAMNTGHDGSLSTGHGNSPEGMIYRLEAMFLQAADFPIEAVRGQIAEAIDVIVHLGRLPDRTRRVLEISEVEGYENGKVKLNKLFTYEVKQEVRQLLATGNQLKNRHKLEMKGVNL